MTLQERAGRIKMVVMDVDGTLTDGAMYYGMEGELMKRFSTRDGMGITLLQRAGLVPAIITSEHSIIAQKRALKLKIDHIVLGSHDKTAALTSLATQAGVALDAVAYIGDDVNDGPVMRVCALAGCPSDAVETIRQSAHFVCSLPGGHGAVREFIEFILRAQGHAVTLTEGW
jgi:3-deoxy-D-manno-octulosonate 8-phosphate phosphatase (KDO 8-P phosphatase)